MAHCALAALALRAVAQVTPDAWLTADAPYCLSLEREKESPAGAEVGVARVWPCGLDATNCSVRVFDADSARVPARILWAAPAEPLTILFDAASGKQPYRAYVVTGVSDDDAAWGPKSGLILETRALPDGEAASQDQVRALWNASPRVYGRSVVSQVFEGLHRHGPVTNFLGRYTGALVTGAGAYRFATISDGPSFLLIDGKTVVEWPDWHSADGGWAGDHNGTVRLEAGVHAFEYLHGFRAGSGFAHAAWSLPGQKAFESIPATAFPPLARYRVSGVAFRPQGPVHAYCEWDPIEHATAGEVTLVTMELRGFPSGKQTTRWSFDDGANGEGTPLRHVFARPGMHAVKLEILDGGATVASLDQPVCVHARWAQQHECPQDVLERAKADLLKREPKTQPAADLAAVTIFADETQDWPWLAQLGPACLDRRGDFGPASAAMFLSLGLHLQGADIRAYEQARAAFGVVLDLQPPDKALRQQALLHFGGYLVHAYFDAAEATRVLDQIVPDALSEADKRLLAIYRADVLLARGELPAAREAYGKVPAWGATPDPQSGMRRTAALESVRQAIVRQDYEVAARQLQNVEWEWPTERLSPVTGLCWIEIFKARQEYPFALGRIRLVMQGQPREEHRSEVLYREIEVSLALGQKAAAVRAYKTLQADHPYSEAAARAKEHYPLLSAP